MLEREQICQLLDSVEDKKDLWLVYELCEGRTMNDHLFDVRGEFYKGERIYMVHHSHFYHAIRTNLSLLKDFIFRMKLGCSDHGLMFFGDFQHILYIFKKNLCPNTRKFGKIRQNKS